MKIYNKDPKFIHWLDKVEEKDNECFRAIEAIIPIFLKFIKTANDKKTLLTLCSFIIRLNTIKNALIVLSKDNNIYSAKILYRVFLEHWLKATYIWSRYIKEKTDDVGIEYMSLGISESLKYGNSVKQVSEILNAELNKEDVWNILCKFDSKLKKLNRKEIENKIKKFEYKNIIKYLVDNNAPSSKWVPIIIPEYSELSSFVHGGPGATDQYKLEINGSQLKAYKGMIRFSYNMCKTYTYSIFLLMFKGLEKREKAKIIPLISSLLKNTI